MPCARTIHSQLPLAPLHAASTFPLSQPRVVVQIGRYLLARCPIDDARPCTLPTTPLSIRSTAYRRDTHDHSKHNGAADAHHATFQKQKSNVKFDYFVYTSTSSPSAVRSLPALSMPRPVRAARRSPAAPPVPARRVVRNLPRELRGVRRHIRAATAGSVGGAPRAICCVVRRHCGRLVEIRNTKCSFSG
jgi:hypothetical protein